MIVPNKINNEIKIGVLSLQGAFEEHVEMLRTLNCSTCQVKNSEELWKCDGLILPGGESTAMSLIAQRCGLWDDLLKFSQEKPVFGTCAGMILLAKQVDHQKKDGQATLGCMDILVDRNFFGSQLASFGTNMLAQFKKNESLVPFFAYFIRAPIVEKLLSEEVLIISQLSEETVAAHKKFDGHDINGVSRIIAVQQKNWLATAFHPELSNCNIFHSHFIEMVIKSKE